MHKSVSGSCKFTLAGCSFSQEIRPVFRGPKAGGRVLLKDAFSMIAFIEKIVYDYYLTNGHSLACSPLRRAYAHAISS